MEKNTATQFATRMNVRRMRSQALASHIMHKITPYLDREGDAYYDVYQTLIEIFSEEGVEIITDLHRHEIGLPPRGPDGWTAEELHAMEKRRLEALYAPMHQINTLQQWPGPSIDNLKGR